LTEERSGSGDNVINNFNERLSRGARNLLIDCADCQPGDKVLIINEICETAYYDPDLCRALSDVAEQNDLQVQMLSIPFNSKVCEPDDALMSEISKADCTIFLARLGDQIRFRPNKAKSMQVINYALDCEMLASPFGTTEYGAFDSLKNLVNGALSNARDIHVSCPAGTNFRGAPPNVGKASEDTTLKRFPVSVFAPMGATGFQGRIAQRGFLTGTGSQYYSPWACELKESLFVLFEGTRITGFEGSKRDVAAAKAHYEFVAQKYEIDTYCVHSWHAGIHPGCEYRQTAGRNFERWSGSAFGNPRLLHFHTCGDYPPGEISLNVLDPTVRIDGVAVWQDGTFHPERIAGGAALLDDHPNMRLVFDNPATNVGQAACGNLVYA
jgi:hypothetical protein